MAKGIWVSDEERVKILQMRKDGVSVSTIAKKTERSTNFIYRILKKANDSVQTKTKHKTCNTSAINGPSAPIAAAESNDRRDRLWGDLPDSTAAFLCAVEGMEVSSYEPIPMPRSMKSFEQRYNQVQQSRLESVNVNVGFAGAPVAFDAGKPQSVEATDEFWLLTDTTSSSHSTDGLNKLLKQIQDEIRRLEGSAQSDLQKTLSDTESSKRARDTDTDGNETSRLLREKLAKEIALLNVHADRETLELERERIRHKTTSMICCKTLLDANTPQADVDQLFFYQ
ncbi:unnamed protein product [Peronospora destructor]|uniref:Tc3 transposase DNA binding domain-containing protein n=1 Tax=Peronospora destructor TaxID=86335 RepID=A0AAV0VFQ8_9STRA|nr:unnamed protein product [Peronospora destructor]